MDGHMKFPAWQVKILTSQVRLQNTTYEEKLQGEQTGFI